MKILTLKMTMTTGAIEGVLYLSDGKRFHTIYGTTYGDCYREAKNFAFQVGYTIAPSE